MTYLYKSAHCCLIKGFVIVKEIYSLISKGVSDERSVDWIRCRAEQCWYFYVVVRTYPTEFYRFGYSHFWCDRSHVNEKEEGGLTVISMQKSVMNPILHMIQIDLFDSSISMLFSYPIISFSPSKFFS